MSWQAVLLATTLVWQSASTATVHLELLMEPGFPPGQDRRWLEVLEPLPDLSIRIRIAQVGEQPAIEPRGRGWHVLGILTRNNQLRLPGGTFNLGDRAALAGWLSRLRADGPEAVTGNLGPFDLTKTQWTELFDKLRPTVGQPTRGKTLADFIAEVASRTGLTIEVDPSLQRELAQTQVADELSKLSFGTALAIALRPSGMVATVARRQGKPVLRVTSADRVTTYWPIGYTPEGNLQQTLPALLKNLSVEINDTPVSEVFKAIEERIGAPILVDHNGCAREGIVLDEVRVTIPGKRTFYKRILDQAAFAARLTVELRVDEAGTPFVWIKPIRN